MHRRSSTPFPEPCDHCQFCEFELVCEEQWRAADSLVHVAGVRPADRVTLRAGRVNTIARLAALDREIPGLDESRRDRFVRQAKLQVAAREQPRRCAAAVRVGDHTDGRAELGVGDRGGRLRGDARARRRRRVPRLRGPPVLARRRRPVLPVRLDRAQRQRRLGVQGAVGARPGRGGGGHQGISSTTSTPAASGSRTCTCTTTTTPSARRWCG